MNDVDILLKAVLSLHVRNYDNQIDYLCDLMKWYNKFKADELHEKSKDNSN